MEIAIIIFAIISLTFVAFTIKKAKEDVVWKCLDTTLIVVTLVLLSSSLIQSLQ